jgi:hypothetical protein
MSFTRIHPKMKKNFQIDLYMTTFEGVHCCLLYNTKPWIESSQQMEPIIC